MARLGDVCTINPRGQALPDDFEVSFVPMQNVSEKGVVDATLIKKYVEVKKGFTYFQEDDVLFAKITPCMENGKGGVAKNLKNKIGFGSTEFHVLRPNPNLIISSWLYYLTSWSEFRRECEKNMTGSAGQKRVPKTFLENYKIELPTLNEQRKIAAVLDKVSDLITKRRQQLDKLDLLVKSKFVEMFGDPENNTKNWNVLPMSEVCSVGSSKRIYQSEQSSSGVPFWRISDLTNLITTGTVTPDLYIPEERYKDLKAQGQVPIAGDILITSRGTLGQCYIVKAEDKFYFQDGMISWLSGYSDNITPLYISYLFSMPGFRKQIDSMQSGSTVAYLSIAMLKKLKVMIPDLEIQKYFISFVEQIEKTKTTISQSLEKLETLKKALMQEYFG